MKIGYETIIWGIRLDDEIKKVLDTIAEAGFGGVEFVQRPDTLGVKNIDELLKLLNERELTFLSLAGGTFKEKISFCGSIRPEYLYMEYWDLPNASLARKLGFIPALHPRVFTPIRGFTDVIPLLEKYPELQLLLDTAHLTVAGEDLLTVIRQAKDRVAAIHFKDWNPEFGRSSHRYARGFTLLGQGEVELEPVLQLLKKIAYKKWIVAELDNPQIGPHTAVYESAKWLAERGFLPRPSEKLKKSNDRSLWIFPRKKAECSPESEARFREILMRARVGNPENFYNTVTSAINELIPSRLISIWTYSPTQGYLALLTSTHPIFPENMRSGVAKPHELLSGIALERQAPVTRFDLTQEKPGEQYGYPNRKYRDEKVVKKLKLHKMITVPIYNAGNQNHVRLLINIYPEAEHLTITDDELYWFGRAITYAADTVLDGLCASASVRVNLLAGRCKRSQDFLTQLISLIQKQLNCEGVSIFLVNETRDKLEVKASTGIRWFSSERKHFYKKREGLTGKVWERNEPLLTTNSLVEQNHQGKSDEIVTTSRQHACLWVPLVDTDGNVSCVVRCRNKKTTQSLTQPNMFLDDDAAILDAIGQAAVPHLQILLEKERRAAALVRLTHELKVPLVAIRGAAEFMLRTKGVGKFFDYDYPGDVWSWSELMRRLLGNADLLKAPYEDMPVQASPTWLRAQVIAAAVKQVGILLRERGFSASGIKYGQFEQIPRLWIDMNQFQQVIFNLLSNAIKYSYDDPKSFQVEIDGYSLGNEFIIKFRDWGRGIKRGREEEIFEEGYRTPEAIERNVTGDGLGLWVVRQIIDAHGGNIKVTKLGLPTEFTLSLPDSLAYGRFKR